MRRKTPSVADQHQDWLGQVDTDGPFLALPVLKDIWPQGVERLGDADDRMITFKQAYLQWQRAFDTYTDMVKTDAVKETYAAVNDAWVDLVLDDLAGWRDLRMPGSDPRLADLAVTSPGGEITVRASGALEGRGDDLGPLLLLCAPTSDLRAKGLDGWAATEIDRMAMLLRKAPVDVGIVTDGQWWAIVWAKDGKPTGSGVVNALTWAEEPLLRDAFLTLIDQRRFRAKDPEQRLARLFERSELEAEEITEELGKQVRQSVELLVQAFSEARLAAAERGDSDPLTDKPDDVYQAAVTIMMRVVFLLFAEERGMLPTEQLYWDSYALRDLLRDLELRAADGEEHLDETFDAWHRLLAVSEALYAGVNYDEMRMPAYGGSLLDPGRFAWLHASDAQGLKLKVSDRVMLHVFQSVQTVAKKDRRRISFRDIDVEQIGYIYEGLLGYTCQTVENDVVLGLVGKEGEEPEISLGRLQAMYDSAISTKAFATDLLSWIKSDQSAATPKSATAIAKLVDKDLTKAEEAELTRLLTPVAGHDPELLAQLVSWGNLIRRDLRDIPYVVPAGGLIVSETPSRKNAGAHYTPRSLAEEIVKYALEPLVYEPGPLQTNDETAWNLKSSTAILDLKVADIAAGSGAFLVAAARFLADRVTEAWTIEDMLNTEEHRNPSLANGRAIREVIARCLYGADINPMAVEMCKLSLWLVSMDKSKPFSFVDDKVFCGNSLLGVTSLDQLQQLHIYPDLKRAANLLHELVDVDGKIAEAVRLREQLASAIDEHNPMRSSRGKTALLEQLEQATSHLNLVADGIVAVALSLGGRPGPKMDDAYKVLGWELAQAFSGGSIVDRTNVENRIDRGLTPTVKVDWDRWKPLHWVLRAPDVFVLRGGFDAVVGNPPFLGDSKIPGALGGNIREFLSNGIAGMPGRADLAAHFVMRSYRLLARSLSTMGLITTNSISQGITREVSLDQLVARGATIFRAVRSRSWPTAMAHLEYAAIWLVNSIVDKKILRVVDGQPTLSVTTLLEASSRVNGLPRALRENAGLAFQGVGVMGEGFFLDILESRAMIEANPNNAEVIFPFYGGLEINSSSSLSSARRVINFGEMSEADAQRYELPYSHLKEHVLPERATRDGEKYPRMVYEWWKFWNSRPRLTAALRPLNECLVIARVSKTLMPVLVSSASVFSEQLVVFALTRPGDLATMCSSMHLVWSFKYASGMRNDPRYSPSDVFETFPRPIDSSRLDAAGKALEQLRSEVMLRRNLGLTALYNLVNTPEAHADADIRRMREIQIEIDEAAVQSYGWSGIPLAHGFHTYRQMERWTVSPAARVEILDRLLELNHRRAREEGQDVPEQGELV